MKNREDRKDRIIAFSNSTEEDLDFAINVEDDKLRPLLKEKQQQEASIQALAEEIAKELKDLSTEELLNFNIQSENKKDLQEVIDSIESGELDNNIDALLFNKKLIEKEFDNFKNRKIWVDSEKRHYCFWGQLKDNCRPKWF